MNRQEALDEVAKCILADRNKAYGDPEDNFRNTATVWNVYLQGAGLLAPGKAIEARDVGILMMGLKYARLVSSPDKIDNYIDSAGYALCSVACIKEAHSGHGSGSASSSVT
jgi:hypothetical protein